MACSSIFSASNCVIWQMFLTSRKLLFETVSSSQMKLEAFLGTSAAILNLCTDFMINISQYLFLIKTLLLISANSTPKLMIFSQYTNGSPRSLFSVTCVVYRLVLKHSISTTASSPSSFSSAPLQSLRPPIMLNRTRYILLHLDPKTHTVIQPVLFVY